MSESKVARIGKGNPMTGADIVQIAKQRLVELTGLEPETVSSVRKSEEGWHVNVDMIELKRIPDSSDLLATYEMVLDDQGNLVRYQRSRRYHRDQVTEAA